jgi:hypothetical protein
MKKSVKITLTQDEYNHLVALKNYFGFKSLVETVSFALDKEINRNQGNVIYQYYVEEARKRSGEC